MWAQEHRQRAAAKAKKVRRYPSDITDAEWDAIRPLMPAAAVRGRPRSVDLREVINGIRYVVRSGGECCRSIFHRGKQCIGGFDASPDACYCG
jgi:hypothetical protein